MDSKPKTFQDWYTSITIEGDMKHNMERAWSAALSSLQPAQEPIGMQPIYYVGHPDGSYSIADPQPVVSTDAQKVRNEALEEAVNACEMEALEDRNDMPEGDEAYNLAIKHCADAIRALQSQPPGKDAEDARG